MTAPSMGRWPKAKAEAIHERLHEIEVRDGGLLTAQAVVDDARDLSSPLHDLFNWNEREAAYQHWLDEARRLIRSVRVVHRTSRTSVSAVFYRRDPSAPSHEQGYVSLPSVLSDDYLTRRAIISDLDRVDSALRRTLKLAEILDETAEIETLLEDVKRIRERFRTERISARRKRAANA